MAYSTSDRVDFEKGISNFYSHNDLTKHAVTLADNVEKPYSPLLKMLSDCYEGAPTDKALVKTQQQGATFKQLAYAAHLADLTDMQRMEWYRVAKRVPLSQRHAGHILQSYGEPTIVKPTESQTEPVAVHHEGGGG